MGKHKSLQVGVGYIVQIGPDRSAPSLGKFKAEVKKVSENASGDTIIEYVRCSGKDKSLSRCNVCLVKKIIKAAPYICTPKVQVNIFRTDILFYRSAMRRRGTRCSSLADLTMQALAGVTNIDLNSTLHEGRLEHFFELQEWPGMTVGVSGRSCVYAHDLIVVRWMTFERWVHANAQRLVKTKAEMRQQKLVFKKRCDDDLRDANEADMQHMMDEDLEREFEASASRDEQMIRADLP